MPSPDLLQNSLHEPMVDAGNGEPFHYGPLPGSRSRAALPEQSIPLDRLARLHRAAPAVGALPLTMRADLEFVPSSAA